MSDLFVINLPTKVYYGDQLDNNLASEVLRFGKNVMIVYGGQSVKRIGLLDRVRGLLEDAGCNVYEYSGIKPNPRHSQCEEAAEMCRQYSVDVVIGIGGGSVLDASKLIAAQRYHNGSAWDLVIRRDIPDKVLPVIAILTNAATGSETDGTAVITNEELHRKKGWKNPLLVPKVAFTDPTLTFSVNPYVTACGCADIFNHVLETYLSPNKGLYMLDTFMEGMMKTVVRYSVIAYQEPENYEARSNIMLASSWAINGFVRSGRPHVWPMHQMEHELSAFYDIPHGHGLAIIMPRYMRYVLNGETAHRFYQLGISVFGVDPKLSDMDAAQETITRLEDWLFNQLSLPSHLSDLGITAEHFQEMAASIKEFSGDPLGGFVPLKGNQIIDILNMCL